MNGEEGCPFKFVVASWSAHRRPHHDYGLDIWEHNGCWVGRYIAKGVASVSVVEWVDGPLACAVHTLNEFDRLWRWYEKSVARGAVA